MERVKDKEMQHPQEQYMTIKTFHIRSQLLLVMFNLLDLFFQF